MIGLLGLSQIPFDAHFTPAVEIGWRFGIAHWNRGYATEGALAVLNSAFCEFQLEQVVSFTTVQNAASRQVMEKIGMHHAASDDFDHPNMDPGSSLCRHVLYRLDKQNYMQVNHDSLVAPLSSD